MKRLILAAVHRHVVKCRGFCHNPLCYAFYAGVDCELDHQMPQWWNVGYERA